MWSRARLAEIGVFVHDEGSEPLWIDDRASIEMPLSIRSGQSSVGGPVKIGAFCTLNGPVSAHVTSIGRYCSIAWGVHFGAFEHALDRITSNAITYHSAAFGHGGFPMGVAPQKPITIENDVMVGEFAFIKNGVTLHTGCVVGAHAVVAKDVPPYAVVVGNPARVVRYRFPEPMVARLLAAEWWRHDLRAVPFRLDDTERLLDFIESGGLEVFSGRWVTGAELRQAVAYAPAHTSL